MNLDFLSNVTLDPVAKKAAPKRTSVPSLPESADLRVFPNGKVYPSKAFAEKFALEFVPKVNVANEGAEPILEVQGNGLDIFSTLSWGMMASARQAGALESEFLCIVCVPKIAAKVDMWSSTKYDEEGQPKASVFTQGINTFSKKQLVPMLAETYGVDWDNTVYVDLSVVHDTPIVSESGVYHIPKIVSTGAKKGEATYIRRENVTVNPLVVTETKTSEESAPVEKDVIAEVVPADEVLKAENGDPKNPDGQAIAAASSDPGEDWAAKLGQKEEA